MAYEIWDKTAGFNLADGTPCTAAEINARYPFTTSGTIIIEKLENGNVGSIDSLEIIKQIYSIDPALSDADALAAIEVARSTPAVLPPTLDELKSAKIADSKTQLAAYLLAHPMTWTDGRQYSATAEKQSLLTSQLALYSVATAAGQTYQLRWNATGGECAEWTYANLSALALAIGAYVQPFVSYQQAREVEITNCTTAAEAEAITIDYASA